MQTNSLKPDPLQPREDAKSYEIDELAESLKEEGFINPIEVDELGTIITGELRWRAAKQAGLKTVPCRVITGLVGEERFIRQVVENVHRHEMSPMATAKAVARLCEKHDDVKVGKMLGKLPWWVRAHRNLLEAPESIQKPIERGEMSLDISTELVRAPKDSREDIADKIIAEGLRREDVRKVVSAINRKPEKEKEILAIPTREVGAERKIQKLSPDSRTVVREAHEVGQEFQSTARDLLRFLTIHAPKEITPYYRESVRDNIRKILAELSEWERGIK
jgi:ParB family chromosome partitioning protein